MSHASTLHLGCGEKRDVGEALHVDYNPEVRPDLVCNLDQEPWPFRSNTFETVYARDILEHLKNPVKAMEEIHRVCKAGAKIFITTPHYSSSNSYTDPTHLHHFGYCFPDYFTGIGQWHFYTKSHFKKMKSYLFFKPGFKSIFIRPLANRFPAFYEEHLAWIFPAWYLYFELEVLK